MTLDQLEAEIRKLPPDQRIELEQRLLGDGTEYSARELEEFDRRARAVREGKSQSVSADEALTRARAKLHERNSVQR